MVISRQWETLIQNKTYGTSTTTISPYIFLSDDSTDSVVIDNYGEHSDEWVDSSNTEDGQIEMSSNKTVNVGEWISDNSINNKNVLETKKSSGNVKLWWWPS